MTDGLVARPTGIILYLSGSLYRVFIVAGIYRRWSIAVRADDYRQVLATQRDNRGYYRGSDLRVTKQI